MSANTPGVRHVFHIEVLPAALVLAAAVADHRAFLGPDDGERRRGSCGRRDRSGQGWRKRLDNFDVDNFGQGLNAGSGDAGESVAASAGNLSPITSPLNNATAIGGSGGNGGNNYAVVPCCGVFGGLPGSGGIGGDAKATAATTILSGSAEADAVSTGGNGGNGGQNPPNIEPSSGGGSGGAATASATGSTGSGDASASATAKGGNGGHGVDEGGSGADANARSTARTTAVLATPCRLRTPPAARPGEIMTYIMIP